MICHQLADFLLMTALFIAALNQKMTQNNLDHFSQWNNLWQMKVNIVKCAVIHYSRSSTLQYNINHQPLNVIEQHPYLRVIIHKSMSWAPHINAIVHKASELYQVKSHLYMCTKEVKETAYLTFVRPCLEYVSSVGTLPIVSNI